MAEQGTDRGAQQNVIKNNFVGTLLFFFENSSVWIYPSPIWSQELGHSSSVWYGLHCVEWALSQTNSGWLLHKLCNTSMFCRQDTILDQTKGLMAGMVFIFLC